MFSFLLQEVSDALDQGFMFADGFMGVGEREMHVEGLMGDLMIYACIPDYVLCLICCLGLLDSFGPL